ncbi:MAG: hypothetical protein ABMA15_20570 [Vicinamibacterales bacterium]
MSDERKYGEEEVAEILDLALLPDETRPAASSVDGLTLREIQDVGQEAGIDPQRISEAALVLRSRGRAIRRETFMGMPVSVGRVVELPRPLTEHEWEILVGELRDTFAAPGRVGSQGAVREWANGNLRVLLEPTISGQQLRVTTLNRRLRFLGSVGAAEILAGLAFLATGIPALFGGGLTAEAIMWLIPSFVVTGAGVGFLSWARLMLPRWASEREAQMEHIATHVRALVENSPADESAT